MREMKLLIQDTTLREGQQTAFVSLGSKHRLELAAMLSDFGVAFIDVMPAVSEGELALNREMNSMGLRANVISLCRCARADIDAAIKADAKWVGLFIGTSQIHLEKKHRMSEQDGLDKIADCITYARDCGLTVRFGLEDASRTSPDFTMRTCRLARDLGAARLTITDTLGVMRPDRMKALVQGVVAETGLGIDVHCHNDLGLALANSLAGIEGGATGVHTTINGCGERVGITRLAELVMALEVLYGAKLDVKKEMLVQLSEKFAEASGMPIPPQMPVVGQNAFKHKSGVHTSALLRDKRSYELFEPGSVGNRRSYVLGDFTGRSLMRHVSDSLHLGLGEEALERELAKIKSKGRDLLEFRD
jgi:isopropylmalate/homocitrate/citramalate synthase